jgi:hypothetical protein
MKEQISTDLGEQIIQKLKLLNKKLDQILKEDENGHEEFSDPHIPRD